MIDPLTEEACGNVYAGDGDWHYVIVCGQSGRQVRGWKKTETDAVAELQFWQEQFGCYLHSCTVSLPGKK